MPAVVFSRPLFLAAQFEPPHSGRGCRAGAGLYPGLQQVSKVNSHFAGRGSVPFSWEPEKA